jgi:hypothetical protein
MISLVLLEESVLVHLRKVIPCVRFFIFKFNIFTTLFPLFVIYLRASLTVSGNCRLILIAYERLMNINCPAHIFILGSSAWSV